jgi:hypothetical protein
MPNGDGRLRVSVSAGTSAGTPTNPLTGLRFTAVTNAIVYIDLFAQAVPFTAPLPPDATQATFLVARQTAGQASTVGFTITDSCGGWPSVVGGGPGAF